MQIETETSTPPIDDQIRDTSPPRKAEDSKLPTHMSRELHNFLADLEELVSKTTTLTRTDLSEAQKQLGEHLTAARQSVEALGNVVDQQARKGATVANEYVHAQPWSAVGIGAGLGVLLGLMLARRS